jgi:hypothetical protein
MPPIPLPHPGRARQPGPDRPAEDGRPAASRRATGGPVWHARSNRHAQALSAKDKELERLAAEGDDWPLFDDTKRISSDEALKQGRLTFREGHQAKLSNSLLKLIRSGRFTQLSLALPQDAAAAAAAAAAERGGHTLSVDGSGHISARVALKVRPLLHMNALMLVFFTAILPALFDRPRALLDWAGLMRTAVALNRCHGWPVARDYVVAALNDYVPQREPFHDFRARLLEEHWMQPAGGLGVPTADDRHTATAAAAVRRTGGERRRPERTTAPSDPGIADRVSSLARAARAPLRGYGQMRPGLSVIHAALYFPSGVAMESREFCSFYVSAFYFILCMMGLATQ